MFKFFGRRGVAAQQQIPEQELEPLERRRAERQNTYADLLAVSANGGNRKRGIVLDLSETGARIRFEYGDGMVDGMLIKIARYGIIKPANVRWRTRTDVGVEFTPDHY